VIACGQCGAADLVPHCRSRYCGWRRCVACHAVSGFACGKQNTIFTRPRN
jgi:hypothetical protein